MNRPHTQAMSKPFAYGGINEGGSNYTIPEVNAKNKFSTAVVPGESVSKERSNERRQAPSSSYYDDISEIKKSKE